MRKQIQMWIHAICIGLLVGLGALGSYGAVVSAQVPDTVYVTNHGMMLVDEHPFVKVVSGTQSHEVQGKVSDQTFYADAQLTLFHQIPLKTVKLEHAVREQVTLCGIPFGIKMYADGALVIGFVDVDTQNGMCCPAREAGLQIGDIIRAVNRKKVSTNMEVAHLIECAGDKLLELEIERSGELRTVILQPTYSPSCKTYKAGLWIRDSCAGIGTLTFVTDDGRFGGLGHGVTDSETEQLIPVEHGEIVPVTLAGITKGARGIPGELRGYFSSDIPIGTVDCNCAQGVFGQWDDPRQGTKIETAFRQEVQRGEAQIYTTVDGTCAQWYTVEIEKVFHDDRVKTQNMLIRVTDPVLLEKTGGIVQGMSGSPLIQNGKLIGAVTHVFVNDPTRGYGIFIENMLAETEKIK